ncbi:MAG TPA: hypothetical protein DDZ80_16560 [Cyanobacteria bacterium UBA8803]|nr:hypothetical protein [Cyanobacteria bacterium UBA9273]HBL60021.1 hypothetical protein [Cyanobacteria bacterium UBA8803]
MSVKPLNFTIERMARTLPLRTVLAISCVLQIMGAVGLVGYLSWRNGEKAVKDLANQLMHKVSNRILQSLEYYTATPDAINRINTNAIRLGQLNLQDSQSLERHLWHQIQVFDSVSYIQFATEQREFVGIARLDNGEFTLTISGQSTNNFYTIYALDSQGNRTNLLKRTPNYDPRLRPWYTAPIKQGKSAWTEIYTYFDFSTLAITEGLPLYNPQGQLLGVTAVDLSLSQIRDFLRTLEVGNGGKTFIVERNGMLVASSTAEQPFIKENAQPKRLAAINSKEPLIRATTKYLQQKYSDLNDIQDRLDLKIDIEGQRHWVEITPFSERFGLDWLIVVVIPESDFMAQIHANTRTTIFLCLGALALSIVLSIFIARWISKPILRLSQASRQIANGELDRQVEVEGANELRVLAQSFNQMAEQLRFSFTALEKINGT